MVCYFNETTEKKATVKLAYVIIYAEHYFRANAVLQHVHTLQTFTLALIVANGKYTTL